MRGRRVMRSYQKIDGTTMIMKGRRSLRHVHIFRCPSAEFEAWCKPWKQSLIVRLLGLNVSMRAMENRLQKLWVVQGSIQIVDIPQGFRLISNIFITIKLFC